MDISESLTAAGGIGGLVRHNVRTEHSAISHIPLIDGNGSLLKVVSDNSVETYEYGPFGEQIFSDSSSSNANSLRWNSRPTDGTGALMNFGYRTYNGKIGCWLNRDPLSELGGKNIYSFVRNRPLSMYDYLGLAGCPCACECAESIEAVLSNNPGRDGSTAGGRLRVRVNVSYNRIQPTNGQEVTLQWKEKTNIVAPKIAAQGVNAGEIYDVFALLPQDRGFDKWTGRDFVNPKKWRFFDRTSDSIYIEDDPTQPRQGLVEIEGHTRVLIIVVKAISPANCRCKKAEVAKSFRQTITLTPQGTIVPQIELIAQ